MSPRMRPRGCMCPPPVCLPARPAWPTPPPFTRPSPPAAHAASCRLALSPALPFSPFPSSLLPVRHQGGPGRVRPRHQVLLEDARGGGRGPGAGRRQGDVPGQGLAQRLCALHRLERPRRHAGGEQQAGRPRAGPPPLRAAAQPRPQAPRSAAVAGRPAWRLSQGSSALHRPASHPTAARLPHHRSWPRAPCSR